MALLGCSDTKIGWTMLFRWLEEASWFAIDYNGRGEVDQIICTPYFATAHRNKAIMLEEQRNIEGATEMCSKSLMIQNIKRQCQEHPHKIAKTYEYLAALYGKQGGWKIASMLLTRLWRFVNMCSAMIIPAQNGSWLTPKCLENNKHRRRNQHFGTREKSNIVCLENNKQKKKSTFWLFRKQQPQKTKWTFWYTQEKTHTLTRRMGSNTAVLNNRTA